MGHKIEDRIIIIIKNAAVQLNPQTLGIAQRLQYAMLCSPDPFLLYPHTKERKGSGYARL